MQQFTLNEQEQKSLMVIFDAALKSSGVKIMGAVSYFITKFDDKEKKKSEVSDGK